MQLTQERLNKALFGLSLSQGMTFTQTPFQAIDSDSAKSTATKRVPVSPEEIADCLPSLTQVTKWPHIFLKGSEGGTSID